MRQRTCWTPWAWLLIGAAAVAPALAQPASELAERDALQWRRGNLHTHSHWSDGDDYLESIALWYRDQGYDFLVFTDHNVLADQERWELIEKTKGGRPAFDKLVRNFPDWVETRGEGENQYVRLRRYEEVAKRFNRPGEFLLVRGEEISDRVLGKPIHLNVSNVEELIQPQGGADVFETIQNNVRAAEAQRRATSRPMIVHLNHPNFGYAVTAEDLMRVRGERFFEVYNGHPHVHNRGDHQHAGTERIWDIVLTHRLGVLGLPVMYGLANDDGHAYHDIPSRASEPGRGWVMVLTEDLTPAALIDSLEAGRFYASSGVTLRRVAAGAESLVVEVLPTAGADYTIEFIGTRRGANLTSEPVLDEDGEPIETTRRYSDEVGQTLATTRGPRGEYRYHGDELYVRARITSSMPHPNPAEPGDPQTAWTQPVVVAGIAE